MSTLESEKMWEVIRPMLKQYILPRWPMVAGGIAAGVVAAAAAGFGLPFMAQYIFPIVFGKAQPPAVVEELVRMYFPSVENMEYALMWVAAACIPLVMAVRGLATYANTYLLTRFGTEALMDLRIKVFERLQRLSFSCHDRSTRGQLMTAVIQYTQMAQLNMVTVLHELGIQPLTLIAAVGYLVFAACTSEESAMLLVNLLVSAACIPLVRMVGKRMVKHLRKAMVGMGIITTVVEETFSPNATKLHHVFF